MHFMAPVTSQILGLSGPQGLGITPIFKCTATKCYATDGLGTKTGTHLLFTNLQKVINRFTAVAGFSPISSDGFIGDGTRAAYARAATWALQEIGRRIAGFSAWEAPVRGPLLATARANLTAAAPYATTKETLAGGAQFAYDALKVAADALGISSTTSVPTPTRPTSPVTPTPTTTVPPEMVPVTTAPLPTSPMAPAAKNNTIWYIAGGILALGLGVASYFVWKD